MKTIGKHFTRWQLVASLFAVIVLAQTAIPMFLSRADAASLTNTYLRLNRMSGGTTSAFRLVFTTSGAGATSVTINFTAAWASASGSVNGTQTVSSASCATETGATALPGSITAAGSSNTVTISSVTALSASTAYCVDLTSTSAVTNATVGTYFPVITAGSDSKTVAVRTLGSNLDQIGVTATVDPTFTFALSSNSAALGTLSSSTPSSATAINATVTTNAPAGWKIWARDASGSPGLTSTSASKTIAYSPAAGASAAALSNGVEGFNMGAGTVTGTCNGSETYDAAFDNTAATSYKGGGLDTTLRTVVSGAGTASSCATPLTVNASISGTTPAANDYAATLTVVAAGVF